MAAASPAAREQVVEAMRAERAAHRKRLMRRTAIIAVLLFPLVLPSYFANMGVRAAIWTLALLSLVVLTGWIGQVSLAQAALMGVGAFSAAQVTRLLNLEFPFHAIVAGAAAALVATGIGLAALRIRGLYLAIATLAFQWMMEASFLEWHPFSGGFNGIGIEPLRMDAWDFSNDRLFFYLAWPTALLLIFLVANLRDSKTGRAWFAIRGSEIAARTLGIDVTRYKLIGFAVSGFIVGVAGALNLNFIGTATPLDYNFQKSIAYLAVAVLGGIGAIAGAVVGAVAFVFSDQIVFGSIASLRGKIEIAAAALLMFTLIRNPGGLITMREEVAERIATLRERRHRDKRLRIPYPVSGGAPQPGEDGASRKRKGETSSKRKGEPARKRKTDARKASETGARKRAEMPAAQRRGATSSDRPETPPPERRNTPTILTATGVTKKFGGLTALDDVSLEIREGEICGLIGPNGAGKTTLFNVLNGLLPMDGGAVNFRTLTISDEPVHVRARMGMGRTFQIMKLFPNLTVRENLMIGTHNRNGSGFLGNLLMLDRSREEDSKGTGQVEDAMAFLGIDAHAEKKVSSLPFGVLRLVELARALVTDPTLLLLDEPASGLDSNETRAFADHLRRIRDEMGRTILLIEHDMSLVMDVCDYVYVFDLGRNLADGTPEQVQSDPAVIAAYLGEEAVA